MHTQWKMDIKLQIFTFLSSFCGTCAVHYWLCLYKWCLNTRMQLPMHKRTRWCVSRYQNTFRPCLIPAVCIFWCECTCSTFYICFVHVDVRAGKRNSKHKNNHAITVQFPDYKAGYFKLLWRRQLPFAAPGVVTNRRWRRWQVAEPYFSSGDQCTNKLFSWKIVMLLVSYW